jgi:hypothetical protein
MMETNAKGNFGEGLNHITIDNDEISSITHN